ncbi:MAG: porin [Alphaproteobacteria bacterium]|nr:porin [Alphaproteobacteria bacterium]
MLFKNYVAVAAMLCSTGFVFAEDNADEDLLLHEIVKQKLAEEGIETGFDFSGDLNLTHLYIGQAITGDKENMSTSLQGAVNLKYLGKADSFGYGFELGAKTKSGIIKQGNAILEVAYVFLDTMYGKLKFGHTNTAADSFNVCGDACLVGYQGFGSGNFRAFYNPSAGAIVDTGCSFDDNKATKIAWLSPTISGFSCGISYTFDSDDTTLFKTIHEHMDGVHNGKEGVMSASSKNVITIGAAYEHGTPQDFYSKLSVSAWFGKGESKCDIKIRDVRAFNIGALFAYKDFQLALGYTDNGKSFLATKYATGDIDDVNLDGTVDINNPHVGLKEGANAGRIYSLGMAYKWNKLTMSLGLFRAETKFSSNEKSKSDIISVATEYKFNKAFAAYVEYDNIRTRSCKRAIAYAKACDLPAKLGDNRANIFMIGTKINF